FATDMQQPLTPLLFKAVGVSKITETIYPARFRHVDELNRMDGKIEQNGGSALIYTSERKGPDVYASDLSAADWLLISALLADGITTILYVSHIERGYTDIVKKLDTLGADIWREEISGE